jgi:hypothetical protein
MLQPSLSASAFTSVTLHVPGPGFPPLLPPSPLRCPPLPEPLPEPDPLPLPEPLPLLVPPSSPVPVCGNPSLGELLPEQAATTSAVEKTLATHELFTVAS